MILLHQLELHNFLSHEKTVIKFKPNQKLLLDGNIGAGKSAIVEALVWALYNESRSDNRALIRNGTTSTKVIVTLLDEKTDKAPVFYQIERTVNRKNKHELSLTEKREADEDYKPVKIKGLKDTQEFLEKEILHSSYLLFVNSIVYLQDNPESFVKQTAAKRKDILLEIINANVYDEYLKKTKDLLQTVKNQLEISDTRIRDKQTQLTSLQETSKQLPIHQQEEIRLRKEIAEYEKKYNELNDLHKVFIGQLAEMKSKEEKSIEVFQQIETGEAKLKELNKKFIDTDTLDIATLQNQVNLLQAKRQELSILITVQTDFLDWQQKINALLAETPPDWNYEKDIQDINEQMETVSKEEIEECPKCGTPYPRAQEFKDGRLKMLVGALKEKQTLKDATEQKKLAVRAKIEVLGHKETVDTARMEAIKQEILKLEINEKLLAQAQGKKELLANIGNDIEKTQAEQKRLESVLKLLKVDLLNKDKILTGEKETKDLLSQQNEFRQILNSNLAENQGRIMMAETAVTNIEKIQKEIVLIETEQKDVRENTEALEAIKHAFGPNGVKAIVIDYVIPQLEDKINAILSKLSDFRIILDTQKSGLGEDVVLEGLFINIINDQGEQMPFENYSGGQRLKIIVAISEALAEVQRIGFRILDELFIGLDENSIEGFTVVMIELQERFSQLICVSHLRQIKDLFPEKITVVNNNGISQIS